MKGFADFAEEWIDCADVTIFLRHNGQADKPAMLLLHGYPQTSAMWHLVAPLVDPQYHVICPDLRGYGRSGKPPSVPDHASYSKRAMAADMIALLDHFGHESAVIGAHDRGARVAHRMGLDHPARIRAMVLLDIAPTREMYACTTEEFARAYWHWFFLIQPAPLPEKLILGGPRGFWLRKCINQSDGNGPFHPEVLEEYLACFDNADTVRASCEDYRAAATIDIVHDNADGRRRLKMPVLVLWAKRGVIGKCFDPMELWRLRADDIRGEALDATHYMAEEIPADISNRMTVFFGDQGRGPASPRSVSDE